MPVTARLSKTVVEAPSSGIQALDKFQGPNTDSAERGYASCTLAVNFNQLRRLAIIQSGRVHILI
jgi:hypothetical protein